MITAVDDKREALKEVYSGEKWQQKVAAMSDSQITAIYLRLKDQGKVK